MEKNLETKMSASQSEEDLYEEYYPTAEIIGPLQQIQRQLEEDEKYARKIASRQASCMPQASHHSPQPVQTPQKTAAVNQTFSANHILRPIAALGRNTAINTSTGRDSQRSPTSVFKITASSGGRNGQDDQSTTKTLFIKKIRINQSSSTKYIVDVLPESSGTNTLFDSVMSKKIKSLNDYAPLFQIQKPAKSSMSCMKIITLDRYPRVLSLRKKTDVFKHWYVFEGLDGRSYVWRRKENKVLGVGSTRSGWELRVGLDDLLVAWVWVAEGIVKVEVYINTLEEKYLEEMALANVVCLMESEKLYDQRSFLDKILSLK